MDFAGLLGGGGGGGKTTSATASSNIFGDTKTADATPLYVIAGLAALALLVFAVMFTKGK